MGVIRSRGTTMVIGAWCLACGAAIPRWRERFVPLRNGAPILTEDGELAIHVTERGACACGGSVFEVRVSERRGAAHYEARPSRRRARNRL